MSARIRFGVYELDRDALELRKHGLPIRLQQQPLRVLVMLTERPGEIVTRAHPGKIEISSLVLGGLQEDGGVGSSIMVGDRFAEAQPGRVPGVLRSSGLHPDHSSPSVLVRVLAS